MKSALQTQLETERFLHAAEYVKNTCQGLKKLTSTELAYLNQVCLAKSEGTWRLGPMQVEIPGRGSVNMSLHSNPLARAREILAEAQKLATEDGPWIGCIFAYTHLVKEHLFEEANRRTAALAAYWILTEDGIQVSPEELVNLKVGDLRQNSDLAQFERDILSLKRK